MKEWRVFWSLSLLVVAMVFLIYGKLGVGEEGLRMAIRATARTSYLYFLALFLAPVVYHFAPGQYTSRWFLSRVQYGMAFLVSHSIHFANIAAVGLLNWDSWRVGRSAFVDIGGGMGFTIFALLFYLVHFSEIHHKWVKSLYTLSLFAIASFFMVSYGTRTLNGLEFYYPFAGLLAVALILRIAYQIRKGGL